MALVRRTRGRRCFQHMLENERVFRDRLDHSTLEMAKRSPDTGLGHKQFLLFAIWFRDRSQAMTFEGHCLRLLVCACCYVS